MNISEKEEVAYTSPHVCAKIPLSQLHFWLVMPGKTVPDESISRKVIAYVWPQYLLSKALRASYLSIS